MFRTSRANAARAERAALADERATIAEAGSLLADLAARVADVAEEAAKGVHGSRATYLRHMGSTAATIARNASRAHQRLTGLPYVPLTWKAEDIDPDAFGPALRPLLVNAQAEPTDCDLDALADQVRDAARPEPNLAALDSLVRHLAEQVTALRTDLDAAPDADDLARLWEQVDKDRQAAVQHRAEFRDEHEHRMQRFGTEFGEDVGSLRAAVTGIGRGQDALRRDLNVVRAQADRIARVREDDRAHATERYAAVRRRLRALETSTTPDVVAALAKRVGELESFDGDNVASWRVMESRQRQDREDALLHIRTLGGQIGDLRADVRRIDKALAAEEPVEPEAAAEEVAALADAMPGMQRVVSGVRTGTDPGYYDLALECGHNLRAQIGSTAVVLEDANDVMTPVRALCIACDLFHKAVLAEEPAPAPAKPGITGGTITTPNLPAVGCLVQHRDPAGRIVPCPGYPHATSITIQAQPGHQPATPFHPFGARFHAARFPGLAKGGIIR